MKPKQPALTYAEHVTLGIELKAMRKRLIELLIRMSSNYGVSSKIVKETNRAYISIDHLRCELDNILCASLPANDDSWHHVYYGDKQ